MSETWTEYGVRWNGSVVTGYFRDRMRAEDFARSIIDQSSVTLVGRRVTASDWLPVDTDGAK